MRSKPQRFEASSKPPRPVITNVVVRDLSEYDRMVGVTIDNNNQEVA